MSTTTPNNPSPEAASTAAQALAAAGDAESARDVGALDDAAKQAALRLGASKTGLVERLIYGPLPGTDELQSGASGAARVDPGPSDAVMAAALDALER
ncbi:MAG: hypothetical protein VYD05_11215, partial [Planctomycetota bacterium]|nr:hypothetical protein [Planctomycetota bacterium]